MIFEEHVGKGLLAQAGIAVPDGELVTTPDAARQVVDRLGPVVVKAQVPAGKRGKAGGILFADTPDEAQAGAAAIFKLKIDGRKVERVLVEARVPIVSELYAAVLADVEARSPTILFSPQGGMDIEELAERDPVLIQRLPIDIEAGFDRDRVLDAMRNSGLTVADEAIADFLARLYSIYRETDAELLEVNPVGVTRSGDLVALDCKLVIDDAAGPRQQQFATLAAPEGATRLEAEAAAAGLKYIELGGTVGVLANGAGLTMTTMDAIAHFGGSAANFLEIGGEAYTKSEAALSILLKNPNVRSVLVNFCGAFARTDVMARGVADAWKALRPDVPIFFTIHGTGEDEANALIEDELGIRPYERMDDAVAAAVSAAKVRQT